MSDGSKYRSRIVERIQVRAGDILPNLRNPKSHDASQLKTLDTIFSNFGIVDALIAYRSERNGGQLTYFDGHGRNMVDADQVWPVDVTDLTDEEVDQLVLYFDEVGLMAKREPDMLADLLREADLEEPELAQLAALAAKNARIDIAGLLGVVGGDGDLSSFLPAPDAGYMGGAGDDDDDEGEDSDPLPLADIRLLQLYFNTAQREEFVAMAEELAVIFNTSSTTDTAMEAMRYAHTHLTKTD